MRKLEIISGCYDTKFLLDGKNVDDVDIDTLIDIINDLLIHPKTEKSLVVNVLELLVNELGTCTGDEEPCEQCGHWRSEVELEIE